MKAILKLITVITILAECYGTTSAQQVTGAAPELGLGKVEPYKLDVTYNKTSHLIFPSPIRYVDLGSDYLVAAKAEDAENVLRVKAAVRDFPEETNFSVITEDGRFYNFDALYSAYPQILSYDLVQLQRRMGRNQGNEVLFQELGKSSPSLAALLMQTIYERDKRYIKHIGSSGYGIRFQLKGIYIHSGKFYFHTALRNKTNIPFRADFISFKVVDKKVARRTVTEQKTLVPLRVFQPLKDVAGKAVANNVFLLDQFSLADGKELIIELYEKDGGRHQVLHIESADLERARKVKDMHLKFN